MKTLLARLAVVALLGISLSAQANDMTSITITLSVYLEPAEAVELPETLMASAAPPCQQALGGGGGGVTSCQEASTTYVWDRSSDGLRLTIAPI